MDQTLFITGGAGFIGANFIHHVLKERPNYRVVNLDALTYAGNLESLSDVANKPCYQFIHGTINDHALIERILTDEQPQYIVHFAAESHVDRSIDRPDSFIQTNVVGTALLLETTWQWWRHLMPERKNKFRFLHISTDEVYGSLDTSGYFTEKTPYAPNSPYSASKAASDHFVRAYHQTYGLPTLTTNCSNNYGAYQYPEKLIPLMIHNALSGKPLPLYGDGLQVRDWLYVEDHCRAALAVLENGKTGETYNIGGHNEMQNIQIVRHICSLLDEMQPRRDGKPYTSQITYVTDRPGHDRRYAIDAGKIERELDWRPQETFETGIRKTVTWYLNNATWCERVLSGTYSQERLGLGV